MTTAWAHLPNAARIDAVIADARARPDKWSAAHTKVWATAGAGDAWSAAWDATWRAVQAAGRYDARDATRSAATGSSLDVIHALVAWDDCAYMLDLPSTTLRTMIDLCDAPVCHQAVLLMVGAMVKEVTLA